MLLDFALIKTCRFEGKCIDIMRNFCSVLTQQFSLTPESTALLVNDGPRVMGDMSIELKFAYCQTIKNSAVEL